MEQYELWVDNKKTAFIIEGKNYALNLIKNFKNNGIINKGQKVELRKR